MYDIVLPLRTKSTRHVKRATLVTLIILSVLVIDQAVKIYIKTHFYYGESVNIFGLEWAQLRFIEN